MKTNNFSLRHIGINESDLPKMLKSIGVESVDELINKTIPTQILLKHPLDLAPAMTEREFANHIAQLASLNKINKSYIGCGWYDTITPAVIQRNVFENPDGILRTLRIRLKSHRDDLRHCLISRL